MSRFISPCRLFGLASLFVLGIGLPTSAIAAPQDPFDPVADELVRIYVDEMTNCDCDYLVVAVLQGALNTKNMPKNGQVVNMFPPGNDGTRAKNTAGTGSGDGKSGAQDHNTTRSNRHTRLGDTGGGGTGSGDVKSVAISHNNTRSNRGSKADTGGGTGSGDTKSGAVNHNSSRSNKGTTTDTGGENDYRFWKSRSGRLGDSGDESNVVQCEHCGASCTEHCRCQPTGLDLIFGHTDDRLLTMESDADGTYLAFETCYGMRSVTLTSMGKDLNLTLVIAKGWRADSLNR